MEQNLNQLSELLKGKDLAIIEKGNFKIEISKETNDICNETIDWYEVSIKYNNEFYAFYDGLSNLEAVLEIIESTSEESTYFKTFKKKYTIANNIKLGNYKKDSKDNSNENDEYVRIYAGACKEYNFNGLLTYLEENLTKEDIIDCYSGKQITTSISSIRKLLKDDLYSKELELINDQLNKKTCWHCDCTVINANNIHYVDNCGCVGKEHICPDCLELHSIKVLSVLNNLPKNATNRDKIEAISYIYSELEK